MWKELKILCTSLECFAVKHPSSSQFLTKMGLKNGIQVFLGGTMVAIVYLPAVQDSKKKKKDIGFASSA